MIPDRWHIASSFSTNQSRRMRFECRNEHRLYNAQDGGHICIAFTLEMGRKLSKPSACYCLY